MSVTQSGHVYSVCCLQKHILININKIRFDEDTDSTADNGLKNCTLTADPGVKNCTLTILPEPLASAPVDHKDKGLHF